MPVGVLAGPVIARGSPCCVGEVLESAGGGVPVHPPTMGVAQDRPGGAVVDGLVDSPSDRGW